MNDNSNVPTEIRTVEYSMLPDIRKQVKYKKMLLHSMFHETK